MSNLKVVRDDDEFHALLDGADDELVVIDFSTAWCGPCKTMEPVFEAMAGLYPSALFLKVDADKCFDTAMTYNVRGVPFFVISYNKTVMETVQGANPQDLEAKLKYADIEIRKVTPSKSSATAPSTAASGKLLSSVTPYIDQENSYCLNDLSPTSFGSFMQGKKLISGKGTGKIMLVYSFTQKMMLRSFKVKGNPQTGPKVLRFFVNHPKVLDFSVGSTLAPSQEVSLSHQDLSGESPIPLRSGSFQIVTNLQILVSSGQTLNSSRIEIESLEIFGAPLVDARKANSANANVAQSQHQRHPRKVENKPVSPQTYVPDHEDIEDNNAPESIVNQPPCCSVQQKQPRTPYYQQRRSPSFNANNYTNINELQREQSPGRSKYVLEDPSTTTREPPSSAESRDQQHRRHHHSTHHRQKY